MAVSVRILTSQALDLALLCRIGAERLELVAVAISGCERTILQTKIRSIVGSVLSDASEQDAVCRVIFGLSGASPRDQTGVRETIEGVSNTLSSQYKDDDRFADWMTVRPCLLRILECESVYLAAKAIDIAYDFERVLTDSRIITSIRPVFDESRDSIVGNTIVQTLRLEYLTSEGDKRSTSLAVDLADVTELRNKCDQAILKAKSARAELEARWSQETLMMGEPSDSAI